jgi:hypothetical protein
LRNAFPAVVESNTVKKIGIASINESYVINALQFIDVIDEGGKKTQNTAPAVAEFRRTNDTSSVIGARQAAMLNELAALSGHGKLPIAKEGAKAKRQDCPVDKQKDHPLIAVVRQARSAQKWRYLLRFHISFFWGISLRSHRMVAIHYSKQQPHLQPHPT